MAEDPVVPEPEQEPSGPEVSEPETGSEPKPEKTLTQAEVDDIVRKVKERERLKRAKLQRELDTQRVQAQPPPEMKGEPQRKDFEDFEEYVAAKASYAAEQATHKRLSEADQRRAEEQLQREQESIEEQWGNSVEKGAAKYADFEKVIAGSDAPMSFAMLRSIKESDIGHEIAYYLANHADEAEEIAGKSVAAQIRAIGRLEEKLAQPKSGSPRPSAPITPVQPRGAPQTELSRSLDNDEWNERWKKRKAEQYRAQNRG